MDMFSAEIKRRYCYARWMRSPVLRYLFGSRVFTMPDDIVTELTEKPPAPFVDIMEQWRMKDDLNRLWGRTRAQIRIIRYYTLRDEYYPGYERRNPLGPAPWETTLLVESICDEIEKIIHQ